MTKKIDDEERAELSRQLSIVAERRVTWEAATRLANERAAQYFTDRKDDLAHVLRDLARDLKAQAVLSSEKQSEILKKLGH